MPKHRQNVEALAELAHVSVHTAYSTRDADQPGDRAEAGTACQRHAKRARNQSDILLVGAATTAPRTEVLREEHCRAVERAEVQHARPDKRFRAEQPQGDSMVGAIPACKPQAQARSV